jgi:thymidylate synthase ThyX
MAEPFPRRVYLLSPRRLSPETIAVTFAKTSRSPLSFEQIAAELSEEKSAEFHEKWVVGYGHASVAEHAVLHIAFENVSRLAVECIEGNRLASYTEKSTRYQKWDPQGYFVAPEVVGTQHEPVYRNACATLFAAYHESLDALRRVVQEANPRRPGESEEKWDGRVRSRYVDAGRFLLPAAALANLGMTANARVLEHAIRKMLAHPLAEVRAIGGQVRTAAEREIPTLLKYANPTPYLSETPVELARKASSLPAGRSKDWFRLVEEDPDGELKVLAGGLYPFGTGSFEQALDHVRGLAEPERRALAETLLSRLGRFDDPLRALEHMTFTAEVTIDQGAYFELKRHRLMTQSPQRLTASLGFAVPRLFAQAGIEEAYRRAMEAAADAYEHLREWNPEVAAYVVPNGFNRRVLMTFNLRQAYHLAELRAAANAHFSMQRLALRLADEMRRAAPMVSGFLRLPQGVNWQGVEAEHFVQV